MPILRQDWINPLSDMLITPQEMHNFYNKPPSPAPQDLPPPHQCEYFFLIDGIDPSQHSDDCDDESETPEQ